MVVGEGWVLKMVLSVVVVVLEGVMEEVVERGAGNKSAAEAMRASEHWAACKVLKTFSSHSSSPPSSSTSSSSSSSSSLGDEEEEEEHGDPLRTFWNTSAPGKTYLRALRREKGRPVWKFFRSSKPF